MSRPNPTFTRDEILAAFIEAHKCSASREGRVLEQFDAFWAFGFLLGHFGIGDEWRTATEQVTA